MTITLSLPIEIERRLREQAQASGKEVEVFVRDAVEEKLNAPKSFREALAPLQAAFADHPMSDDEAAKFFEPLREEAWAQRQARANQDRKS